VDNQNNERQKITAFRETVIDDIGAQLIQRCQEVLDSTDDPEIRELMESLSDPWETERFLPSVQNQRLTIRSKGSSSIPLVFKCSKIFFTQMAKAVAGELLALHQISFFPILNP